MPFDLDEELRQEYDRLFQTCRLRPEHAPEVASTVQRMARQRDRYAAVEQDLHVPWFVVGTIHAMEGGLDFSRHLHNGDPLTGRTVQKPAGRPRTGSPPFAWEQSAADALTLKGLHRWNDWSIAGALYVLEAYNGWGYRTYHKEVKTPYLWSYSNHYTSGKYVKDGKWSRVAVSKQCGAAVLLQRMQQMGLIAFAPGQTSSASAAATSPSASTAPPALASNDGTPLIRFWTGGPPVIGGIELQEFLNRLPGIHVDVDGRPGTETSNAFKRATGRFLLGDPRAARRRRAK